MNPDLSPLFAVIGARGLAHSPARRMHLYAHKGLYILPSFFFSVCMLRILCRVFVAFCTQLFSRPSVREASRTVEQ